MPAPQETVVQESVAFQCNICGTSCEVGPDRFGRDVRSCSNCNSTPRFRSVVYVLSRALFGQSMTLAEFPSRPDLRGIGLTDFGYAPGLADKLGYTNTFYDHEPRLDITDPPAELYGTLDFLISSDVFEHVPPPVEVAFEKAFHLLKPGGVLILTIPYLMDQRTIEHFPSLRDFEIVEFKGSHILLNRTANGDWEVFDNLRFHGGEGLTLEMRILSYGDVIRHLKSAGFEEIEDWKERYPEFGGCWQESHSFPFAARRPQP